MPSHVYGVIACSRCKEVWSVELANRTSSCPRCNQHVHLARRRRLWEGNNPREAQAATATLRAQVQHGVNPDALQDQMEKLAHPERLVQHDSLEDAASAQARDVTNLSKRAERVTLWLGRLCGTVDHDQLIAAFSKAGIPRERGEREVLRMLVSDYIYEPHAGQYAVLGDDGSA